MTTIRYTLSLPQALNAKVKDLAVSLGLPVATFIRHLVIQEVKKTSMPVFSMSQQTEEVIQKADQAYSKGELSSFSSPDEMFDNLEKGL
ncbi:hypothetical protein KKD62_03355 [Patescibacteria group bacterium]|nr:hypothetical protein [Patescibacteria group bacterium]MBU1931324.1 hypothetical protein [Patescibacteria group bacterium]